MIDVRGFGRLAMLVAGAWLLQGCGGQSAPELSLEPLHGKTGDRVKLSSQQGKVVILDFWATWCAPCRQSMPKLDAIYRKYKDRGLVVMGVTDEPRPNVNDFALHDSKTTYPLYLDPHGDAGSKYGADSIPMLFLIDKNGKIVRKEVGLIEDTRELEKEIEKLL
jgi:thiol-disulfide isomerase/thioredoxin